MMRINFDTLRRAWTQPFARKVVLAAGMVVVGAAGLAAVESRSDAAGTPDKAACCTSAVSTGDAMISPAMGADKDFFEVPSSPPSVMFLLGNNKSMQDFPIYLPEDSKPGWTPVTGTKGNPGYFQADIGHFVNTGCSDPELLKQMTWFNKDSPVDKLNGSLVYDNDPDLDSTYFDPSAFYHVRGRRVAWRVEESPYSMGIMFKSMNTLSNPNEACRSSWGYEGGFSPSALLTECMNCLATKGWWRGPILPNPGSGQGSKGPAKETDEEPFKDAAMRKWVVSGRVLNVRPPKFVVARKVLKDVINSASNVRMGVATFGVNRGWFDPPDVVEYIRPTCDASFPAIIESKLDRPKLTKAINKIRPRNNERSIGEALFGLGGYFSSQTGMNTWTKWFQQPIGNSNYGWPGQPSGGTINNPYGKQEGNMFGVSGDEWLKGNSPPTDDNTTDPPTKGVIYPGQRFEVGGEDRSVCFDCQVSSIIVLTDGEPRYDNSVPITKMMSMLIANGARHETKDKAPVTANFPDPRTSPNDDPGGINYCDQFWKDKDNGVKFTKEDCDYTYYNWPTGLLAKNKNFMDDVSFFLAHTDLREDKPGTQAVRTYTIGYGDNSAMLQSIAMAGKGKFYRADNPEQLRDALLDVLGDIKQLSTSFASANIAGVQTGGMQSSTFVPRFVPRRGRPYEGHLFRFFYFNEFAQGCQPIPVGSSTKDPFDLNKDGDCDDAFFLDKPADFTTGVPDISAFSNLNRVQENNEGVWVKVATATQDAKGVLTGGVPAQPFWDLNDTLDMRKADAKCDMDNLDNPNGGRCIFTMIDRDGDGKFTAQDNPPVEFHQDNAADLKNYLLASGDGFCNTLFAKAGQPSWTGTPAQQDQCVKLLIRFVRGVDVFDYDRDGEYNEARPCADSLEQDDKAGTDPNPEVKQHQMGQKTCKLADIFHSTPVTVEPPVDPFLCSLGLSSQCTSTLYEDFSYSVSSEPLCATGGSAKPCYKATPLATPRSAEKRNGVYDEYLKDSVLSTRARIALVGSNGGMLHAVHVGKATTAKGSSLGAVYDVGTGQEIWAFVPPDLMPKLNLMVSGHEYFVDGTPMVRDIWADGVLSGSRDGIKQKDEFRTLAIIGERSGGQRYTALDVTDPYLMIKAVKNGSDKSLKPFRWMFPNACDPESITMGQSWSNFAPKPPPIGAVRLKATGASSAGDQDRGWEERWVTVLNGGYSPDLTRGRGVYMVDAWTGDKLWAAEAQPDSASGPYAAILNQMKPVAASAALVDIGKGEGLQRDLDGFFDTMIFGDMGGQVWTFRLKNPGEFDSDTHLVKNWFGARSLEVQREEGSANAHQKAPFFHVTSTVLQPDTGWLRGFVGTGDRQHLRTTPGTDCSADDLLACIRLKCDVKASFVGEVSGQKRTSLVEYKAGVLVTNKEGWLGDSVSACSASKMELSELSYSCPSAAYGSVVYPTKTYSTQSNCSTATGKWECTRVALNTSDHHDQKLDETEKVIVGTNRYFGFHAYGGTKRIFDTQAGAIDFDKLRVTDKQNITCEGLNCSLVDVTIPDNLYSKLPKVNDVEQRYISLANFAKLKGARAEDPGWFIRYNNTVAERTATGATVLSGVVFWSSFSPSTTAGADACSLSGMNDRSFSWQADAITGLPNQASGFQLSGANAGFIASRENPTTAPPGEPSPIIAMSATGGIRYQVALSSAGSAPTTETLSTRKNTTPDISWMEVPRNLHECRHENSGACVEEPAP